MAPLTNTQLAAKIAELEKQVLEGRNKDLVTATEISEKNFLNLLAKSYDKNIRIIGLNYNIKESQSLDADAKRKWFCDILKRALVDTCVVKEEDVLDKAPDGKLLMRGIVSDIHPLAQRNGATIVIAFNEAWFANQIKETVRKSQGLKLKKGREEIRICAHLPPILEALHNEALRARRTMLETARTAGSPRKIHCNVKTDSPWIQLIEVVGGEKRPLPFLVEDGRLADPANAMAVLELSGQKFTPYKFLSEKAKKKIPKNILRAATPFSKNDDADATAMEDE